MFYFTIQDWIAAAIFGYAWQGKIWSRKYPWLRDNFRNQFQAYPDMPLVMEKKGDFSQNTDLRGFFKNISLRNWGSKSDPCKGHTPSTLMAIFTDAIVSALHENYALTCRLILSTIQDVVWLLHDDVIKRKPFPRYWPFVAYIYENLCRMLGFDPPMSGIILGMGFANERNRGSQYPFGWIF